MSDGLFLFTILTLFVALMASYALYMRHMIAEATARARRSAARRMRSAAVDLARRYEESAPSSHRTVYSTMADRLAELPLENETPTWRRT